MKMDIIASTFIAKVEELANLLSTHGVKHWPKELRAAAATARQDIQKGATRYLSFVGGMGSLTDVWICRANGHIISDTEEVSVNHSANHLQDELYSLAKQIERQ